MGMVVVGGQEGLGLAQSESVGLLIWAEQPGQGLLE